MCVKSAARREGEVEVGRDGPEAVLGSLHAELPGLLDAGEDPRTHHCNSSRSREVRGLLVEAPLSHAKGSIPRRTSSHSFHSLCCDTGKICEGKGRRRQEEQRTPKWRPPLGEPVGRVTQGTPRDPHSPCSQIRGVERERRTNSRDRRRRANRPEDSSQLTDSPRGRSYWLGARPPLSPPLP